MIFCHLQSFANEDQLAMHKKKHDMMLNLNNNSKSAGFVGKLSLDNLIHVCRINIRDVLKDQSIRSRSNSDTNEILQKLRGGWLISRSAERSQSFRGDVSEGRRGWKYWHTCSIRGKKITYKFHHSSQIIYITFKIIILFTKGIDDIIFDINSFFAGWDYGRHAAYPTYFSIYIRCIARK